jgi:hypothetical protein
MLRRQLSAVSRVLADPEDSDVPPYLQSLYLFRTDNRIGALCNVARALREC